MNGQCCDARCHLNRVHGGILSKIKNPNVARGGSSEQLRRGSRFS